MESTKPDSVSSGSKMELNGWRLGILIALLLIGLILSIASIITSVNCSKTCNGPTGPTGDSSLKSANLGADDNVGPTGPPGPGGPTLSSSFAIAYGYIKFNSRSTQPVSPNFVYGATITRDNSTYAIYTVTFNNEINNANYSIVANAEASDGDSNEKGHLICSIVSSSLSSKIAQIRVYDTGSKALYAGTTFLTFMVSG